MILLNSVRFSDLISLALLAFRMFPYHPFMLEQDRWGGNHLCHHHHPAVFYYFRSKQQWEEKSKALSYTHSCLESGSFRQDLIGFRALDIFSAHNIIQWLRGGGGGYPVSGYAQICMIFVFLLWQERGEKRGHELAFHLMSHCCCLSLTSFALPQNCPPSPTRDTPPPPIFENQTSASYTYPWF